MFKEEVAKVIKDIASIQLESLDKIITGHFDNNYIKGIYKLFEISLYEVKDNAEIISDYYKSILVNPENIYLINEFQLGVCGHILFKMEDTWVTDNPEGIRETWNIFHTINEKFHPEYSLIL